MESSRIRLSTTRRGRMVGGLGRKTIEAQWWELAIPAAAGLGGGWLAGLTQGPNALRLHRRQTEQSDRERREAQARDAALSVRDLLIDRLDRIHAYQEARLTRQGP